MSIKLWKSGFTLAEVLITLGIIGVVAALTMPVLIANYRKQQTVTQLKKVYSALQQSIQFSQANYGDIDSWDWSLGGSDFFEKYLSKFMYHHLKQWKSEKVFYGGDIAVEFYNEVIELTEKQNSGS